ncbi:sensor histidine kinase [Cellulomonas xiejunii]|uniref:Sensor histidine kinase n=1 Tax=Cellulomonas xiejunii TaxID=2968083 RepID=A0ABY5KLT4_9CELL|nr:sensor histidine kinase [Cellulomonas xiejunii]MCC2312729.1 sensor histidine kinase [Cellulomonas xiejunii]MCC2320401.1 sensor histidine kinase [Cellulomonas xiejunii]UUI70698.1 sensor histidine kinase [Cellulomonas xiejunii]
MTPSQGFHRRIVSTAMFVRLGAIVVALFGLMGETMTAPILLSVLALAGTSFGVLLDGRVLDVLRKHPLVLVVDISLNLALVAVLGVENPLVLATFPTALLIGMLWTQRFAVVGAAILAAGYVLVVQTGQVEQYGFMLDVGVPALYLCLVGIGGAVRAAHREQVAAYRAADLALRAVAASDERARLAREMHDSLGKTLHGIALGARGLVLWVERDPAQARVQAIALAEASETAAQEAREILVRMRTDQPDRPLVDVLGDICQQWEADHGVPCEVVARCAVDLPTDVRYEVLAIIGEALENAARHADATRVRVELEKDGPDCRITVADDGTGFMPEPDGHSPRGHFGLTGMHERAAEVGIQVRIASRPGAGTRVEVVHRGSHDPSGSVERGVVDVYG